MERFVKTKTEMNFRSAPSVESGKVITRVPKGGVVQVLEAVSGKTWYKAKLENGTVGYISSMPQYVVEFTPAWLERAKKLVDFIDNYLDVPYVFGSKRMDPKDFDCSDLMQWGYSKALGIKISGDSRSQFKGSPVVKDSDLRTGDLLFFSKDGTDAGIYHVGMYVDKDKMLHTANNTGKVLNENLKPTSANGGNGIGGVTYVTFAPGSYWRKILYKANRPNKD